MSHRTHHSSLNTLAAKGPHIMLWAAANRTAFTVCRADGRVISHEQFDTEPRTTAAASEAAARQAVWIAGCVRNDWGANAATLHLALNNRRGVDTKSLERHAYTVGLVLDLSISPVRNPAARPLRIGTYVDWRRTDLGALIQTSGPAIY